MELASYEVRMCGSREFKDLHDPVQGMSAGKDHACCFQLCDVSRIDFISMTESLTDGCLISIEP